MDDLSRSFDPVTVFRKSVGSTTPLEPRLLRVQSKTGVKDFPECDGPEETRNPCCDVKINAKIDPKKMEHAKCIAFACPGDVHPKNPDYRFHWKESATGAMGYYMFASRLTEGVLDQPCGVEGSKDYNSAAKECKCMCSRPGLKQKDPAAPKNDCSFDVMTTLEFKLDCHDMPDAFKTTCLHSFSAGVCYLYHYNWRHECTRTCRALMGVSCVREEYDRYCERHPECPAACKDMATLYCESAATSVLNSHANLVISAEEIERLRIEEATEMAKLKDATERRNAIIESVFKSEQQ
eukprot:g2671.t1